MYSGGGLGVNEDNRNDGKQARSDTKKGNSPWSRLFLKSVPLCELSSRGCSCTLFEFFSFVGPCCCRLCGGDAILSLLCLQGETSCASLFKRFALVAQELNSRDCSLGFLENEAGSRLVSALEAVALCSRKPPRNWAPLDLSVAKAQHGVNGLFGVK